MFAVIKTGGKQYSVTAGDIITVMALDGVEGDAVTFDDVLMVGCEGAPKIGAPTVAGAVVTGTVVKNGRAPKIIVFKFKRRKGYKKKKGHRQGFTAVKIEAIA